MICNMTHLMCQVVGTEEYNNDLALFQVSFPFSMPGVDLTCIEPTLSPVGEVILLDKATGWCWFIVVLCYIRDILSDLCRF